MKHLFIHIYKILLTLGIDPLQTIRSIKGLPLYFRNFQLLLKQKSISGKEFPFGKLYPCLGDRFADSGSSKGHYFHQDLLVARRIYQNKPNKHVDVGSRIDGFVAHVASFRSIEFIDIRPLSSKIPNVKFMQANLMLDIRSNLFQYCDSLSC
jgi:hypothetical protein